MDSTLAVRLWTTCKEAGRPWPTLDDDPVIDFMVMEAVGIKVAHEAEKRRKEAEVKEWRSDTSELEAYR